ncbi:peptide chain release factor-like protein [Legionella taurinensis]|uniref:Peptide chain release factor-like protein n=1 Tax=Legionella taurinensis TaxID=70611 RepID=A0A3A5L964_9GAMM|nr:peptide chain release factor-like protein [Legionella taurinensis]MDX1837050.1 peptide chain release factor-like protein [Legionella taurinensis]PUT41453.1 peptide chain release factor-like protein [Legionella taurinensis]PUT42692.1 peptide chain release factor-like protein [Legionella taurinensis]PUT46720.1 peptide chain release factor-like protein [Legionella taurinensis]PUT47369.1 peptide chain release factor-like protein [Legionella taurinensis]
MISKDKWESLKARMAQLEIDEAHLVEKFIIGSGKGGQKLHKTASTVYLKHLPTGFEIKCQDSRYREDNRYFARLRLCEKMHTLFSEEKSKAQQVIEKLRRQKQRRSRRAKQRMLQEKAKQSQIKQLRQKPSSDQ